MMNHSNENDYEIEILKQQIRLMNSSMLVLLNSPAEHTSPDQDQPGASYTSVEALKEENELLKLQLEQLREELDYQIMRYSEPPAEFERREYSNTDLGVPIPPSDDPSDEDIFIDFRHYIEGLNWHGPEHDGRWGGPELYSAVKLPTIDPGTYKMTIRIVGAMSREILDKTKYVIKIPKGTSGSLLKKRINDHGDSESYPVEVVLYFSFDGPASGRPDLLILCPKAMSPSDRGEPDSRVLTIRIASVSLTEHSSEIP